jgi:hypothetical protein
MYSSDIAEKMGVQTDSASAIDNFRKVNDSVRREILYNILTEFGVLNQAD